LNIPPRTSFVKRLVYGTLQGIGLAIIILLMATGLSKLTGQDTLAERVDHNSRISRERADRIFGELEAHRIRNEQVHYIIECVLLLPPEERSDDDVVRCENEAKRFHPPEDKE
jgi:hypothetical protein